MESETEKQTIILEDRPLTQEEIELLKWLIENRQTGSEAFLSQINHLRVVSRCGCGCASIDFSFDNVAPNYKVGLDDFSNWYWGTEGVNLSGVFGFARDGRLAGIEVWSVDGARTPTELPKISELREFTDLASRRP